MVFLKVTFIFLLFFGNCDHANSNNLLFLFKLILDTETSRCTNSYKSTWIAMCELKIYEKMSNFNVMDSGTSSF